VIKVIVFIFISFLWILAKCDNKSEEVVFFDFENEREIWYPTKKENNILKNISISSEKFLSGQNSLKIEINFPGEVSIEKEFFKDLSKYKNLILNIYPEGNYPEDAKILIFLQDKEWLWYQSPLFTLEKNKWNKITLNTQPDSPMWENIGHNQPWCNKTVENIKRIGVKLFSQSSSKTTIYIDRITGEEISFPEYTISQNIIKKYEKFEINVNLPLNYKNPFDSEEIQIDGFFFDPTGKEIIVPGFYYQKYINELGENGEETLIPDGYPFWKIRFTPTEFGKYRFYIKVKYKEEEKQSKEGFFTVLDSENPGFIGISKIDPKYFAFPKENFFYPIGINIRSPTDTRYALMLKKDVPMDTGTFYYEKIFKEMNENGENFTEIWLAPWFAGLEWIETRPGYKGVGYYNMRNAWKIDRILELAEKYNIYLQLVIINHGQLSTFCDEEWQDNPYNEKNNGFLKSPEEFFTNPLAKEYTKKKLRYIIGRWSYSPNIFSWILLNEINLVGSDNKFYLSSTITSWYDEMSKYLKKIDPYKHLVSAHYTILIDNELLKLPTIDFIITNAYYDVLKGQDIIKLIQNINNFNSKFGKPHFISEYGGTPWGASEKNLKRDIIAGLWGCFHLPFSGAPIFWWHRFIEEFKVYNYYKNFSTYVSDIDRIKLDIKPEEIKIGENQQLNYLALGNSFFTTCWIYDPNITKNIEEIKFPKFSNIKVLLNNKIPGKYELIFWDMEKGLISKKDIFCENNSLKIELPPFEKWIAFKIKFIQ